LWRDLLLGRNLFPLLVDGHDDRRLIGDPAPGEFKSRTHGKHVRFAQLTPVPANDLVDRGEARGAHELSSSCSSPAFSCRRIVSAARKARAATVDVGFAVELVGNPLRQRPLYSPGICASNRTLTQYISSPRRLAISLPSSMRMPWKLPFSSMYWTGGSVALMATTSRRGRSIAGAPTAGEVGYRVV